VLNFVKVIVTGNAYRYLGHVITKLLIYNLLYFQINLKVSVIIFHGDADRAIYHGSSKKLSSFFKEGDKLFTLKDEGHTNFINNIEYLAVMMTILK